MNTSKRSLPTGEEGDGRPDVKKPKQSKAAAICTTLREHIESVRSHIKQLKATIIALDLDQDNTSEAAHSTGRLLDELRLKMDGTEERLTELQGAPVSNREEAKRDTAKLEERVAELEASLKEQEQNIRKTTQAEQLQLQIVEAEKSNEEWHNTTSQARKILGPNGHIVEQESVDIHLRKAEVLEILRRIRPEDKIMKIYAPRAYPNLELVEFDCQKVVEDWATERVIKYVNAGEPVEFEAAWYVVRGRLLSERQVVLWAMQQIKVFQDFPAVTRNIVLGHVIDFFNRKFTHQVSRLVRVDIRSLDRSLILGGNSDTLELECYDLGPYNEEKLLELNLENWRYLTNQVVYFSKI